MPAPSPHPRPRPTTQALAVLGRAAAVALGLGRRVVAAATGETGRRLARAAALTVLLAVVVTALYDWRSGSATTSRRARSPAVASRCGSASTPAR
jgi:hypothetical protein